MTTCLPHHSRSVMSRFCFSSGSSRTTAEYHVSDVQLLPLRSVVRIMYSMWPTWRIGSSHDPLICAFNDTHKLTAPNSPSLHPPRAPPALCWHPGPSARAVVVSSWTSQRAKFLLCCAHSFFPPINRVGESALRAHYCLTKVHRCL